MTINSGTALATNEVRIAGLSLGGGTGIFDAPATIGGVTLNGGTLSGSNTVTATNVVWTTGRMSGLGQTIIPTNGTFLLRITGNPYAYLDQRVLVNQGSAIWTNATAYSYAFNLQNGAVVTNLGTWDAYVDHDFSFVSGNRPAFHNLGTFTKSGLTGRTRFYGVPFHNQGTVEVLKGTLELAYGGTQAGVFEVATNTTLTFSGASPTWEPTARISGDGQVILSVPMTMAGDELAVKTLQISTTVTFNNPVNVSSLTLSGTATFQEKLTADLLSLSGNGTFNGTTDLQSLTQTGTGVFNGAGRIGSLALNGGNLSGSNTVTVTNLTWTTGRMSGSGQTVIPAEGTFQLRVTGSPYAYLDQRVLVNQGSAIWTNATAYSYAFNLQNGAVVTNLGTWDAYVDHDFSFVSGNRPAFYNLGTFTKSGLTGRTRFYGVPFHNQGTVQVLKGTLEFAYGGTQAGVFEVATNTTLTFSGASPTWEPTARINGEGNVILSVPMTMDGGELAARALQISTTVTLANPVQVGSLTLSGTANFNNSLRADTVSLGGNGTFNGVTDLKSVALTGTGTFNGAGNIGSLTLTGGYLGGTNVVIVTNLVWTTGRMTGSGQTVIPTNGTMLLNIASSPYAYLDRRALVNHGNAVWTNRYLFYVQNGAVVTNLGTWEIQYDAEVYYNSGNRPAFYNLGTLVKTGGTGTTRFNGVSFHNHGVVRVLKGTLESNFGGEHQGQFEADTNAVVFLNGAVNSVGSSGLWTGAGRVRVAGTLNFNGQGVGVGFLEISSGSSIFNAPVMVEQAASISGTAVFTESVTSGSLTVGGSGTFNGVVQANAASVSGAATFNQAATVGSMTLTGTGTFNGAGNLESLALSGGNLSGSNTVTVTNLTWTTGRMTGSGQTIVATNGNLLLNLVGSPYAYLDQRALVNQGNAVWTNRYIFYVQNGAVVTNLGTWEIQYDAEVYYNSGSRPAFYNLGTLVKTAAAGTTRFNGVAFHNQGLVRVLRGTLDLYYGGSHSGTFEVATNTTLYFSGGTHAWAETARVEGEGRVVFSAAATVNSAEFAIETLQISTTMTFNQAVRARSLTLGGTATFNDSLTADALSLGGTGTFNGTTDLKSVTLTGTGTFNSAGNIGSLNLAGGYLGGTNVVTVTNLIWTTGRMTGSGQTVIPTNGTMLLNTVGSPYAYLDQRALVNQGNAIWTNRYIFYVQNGAVVTNFGTWEIQYDAEVYHSGGSRPAFYNLGTLAKTGSTGTTRFNGVPFHNQGLVQLLKGTLDLYFGGTQSGHFELAANTTLYFSGGTHVWEETAQVEGEGRVIFSAPGTVNGAEFAVGTLQVATGVTFNNPVLVDSLALSGNGTFNNSLRADSLNLSGSGTFNQGTDLEVFTLAGSGIFNGAANVGSLNLSGGTLSGTNTVTVSNLVWTTGWMSGSGQTIVPTNGTMLLNIVGSPYAYLDRRVLVNHGNVAWTNRYLFYVRNGAVVTNFGIWEAQSDADFYHNSGDRPAFYNYGTFLKNGGTGAKRFYATPFYNEGTVEISSGTLQFEGDRYQQTAGSTVLNGGGLSASPYPIEILGGDLSGSGTVSANVVNRGVINPGGPLGILTINGALSQYGVVNLEISGLGAGSQYDRLAVSGAAALGGILQAAFLEGFRPNAGESFDVMTYGSRTGGFFGFSGLDFGDGTSMDPVYSPTVLSLVTTNGPTNLLHLTISSPVSGTRVNEEDTVTFQVDHTGGIPPFEFTWQSDLDGVLGTGAVLEINTLSPGTHRVFVRGQDSAGSSNVASVTLTVLPAASTVAVDLQSASDTGASNTDNLTRLTTLGFDVTVSKSGYIEFDFKGDGLPEEVRTNDAAGTYTFQAGPLSNGLHNITAKFVPNRGITVTNSLAVTVDLIGPTLVAVTPTGPVSNRLDYVDATFDSALDAAAFGPIDIRVEGVNAPAIGSVQVVSSNKWRLRFSTPPGPGTYEIVIGPDVLDRAGNPMDQDGDGQVGEPNDDVFRSSLTVHLPDLLPLFVSVPTNAQMGQPITVSLQLTNAGTATAAAPWQNIIRLATNAAGDGAIYLTGFPSPTALAPGQSLTVTQSFILPVGQYGERFLTLSLDTAAVVFEGNETNNTVIQATALTIQATDLRVVSILAPDTAQFGQVVSLDFAVTNAGSGPALASWTDRVYLSTHSNSVAGATLLATRPASDVAPLAADASYSRTESLALPLRPDLLPGLYFLIVQTDAGNAQPETAEVNNLSARPITLGWPPLPDLAVTQIQAPTTAQPGQTLSLVWSITNQGSASVPGPWRELLLISNSASGLKSFAEYKRANLLAPAGSLVRTQSVTLPADTQAGPILFALVADSRADVLESNEANNAFVATNLTTIPSQLTLSLTSDTVAEGASVNVTVSHNGDRSGPVAVALLASDETELAVTNQIAIPAGQASAGFLIWGLPDGTVDGPQAVTLLASANGFESRSNTVTVLDVDLPTLALSPPTGSIDEGQIIVLTVTRDYDTNQPLEVAVSSSNPARLLVPPNVVIPAGQWTHSFEALGVDDSLVQGTLTVTLNATATGYRGTSAQFTVSDEEAVPIMVQIRPLSISEGGGPQAAVGTVSKALGSSRPMVLELQSSPPGQVLVPTWVAIPAGATSATFTVGAVDNALVDGRREVTLTPFVTASGTDTRLYAGLPAILQVTDDDGPTLKVFIARRLVAEGLAPASTAVVSRNTNLEEPLEVALASSDTTEATVLPAVTIPTGQSSVTFEIVSVSDNLPDGNQEVTITASAAGFSAGSDAMVVSDIDFADLTVEGIHAPAASDTDANFSLSYQILNQGLGPTRSNFLVRLFLSTDPVPGGDTLLNEYQFTGNLEPGQTFNQTLQLRAPAKAGDYWFIVVADTGNHIREVLEDNNTRIATVPMTVAPAYRATVETDVDTAVAGTAIPLRGRAYRPGSNLPVPGAMVTIHLNVRGINRLIAAFADEEGNYATSFTPLPTEAGRYTVGADHPGVAQTAVQDEFSLLGFKSSPAVLNLGIAEQASVTGTVALVNLGELPLTGLSASVVGRPDNLVVDFAISDGGDLPGGARIALNYSIAAVDASYRRGTVLVQITSAEGAAAEVAFQVTVRPLRPNLVANPSSLFAGMARGRQTVVHFDVANVGGASSGPLTITLPAVPWLRLAVTNPLPSLGPGETNRVALLLTPPADLALGTHGGTLVLNSDLTGLAVPFEFRALSDARGDLKIVTVDEYTYYGEGAPKLSNATVKVTDSLSRQMVASGATDSAGELVLANLPEAYYEIEVRADEHGPFRTTLLLTAGRTNTVTAFLPRQAVRYSWTVVPTEIEDRTRITLETTFEAFVPMPVVTVEPASLDLASITQDFSQVLFTIHNHGLVAAQAAQFYFEDHPLWEVAPLIEDIGEVPALSSITVPVTLRKISPAPSPQIQRASLQKADTQVNPCNITASVLYQVICGNFLGTYQSPIGLYNAADCGGKIPTLPPPQNYQTPQWAQDALNWVQSHTPSTPDLPQIPPERLAQLVTPLTEWLPDPGPVQIEAIYSFREVVYSGISNLCDPCTFELTVVAGQCAAGLAPKTLFGLFDCLKGGYGCVKGGTTLKCARGMVNCAGYIGEDVSGYHTMVALFECAKKLWDACPKTGDSPKSLAARGASGDVRKAAGSRPAMLAAAREQARRLLTHRDLLFTLYGDEAWLRQGMGPNFSAWMAAFNQRTDDSSEEGLRVSSTERAELLALPHPEVLGETNLVSFLDRWNRSVDYEAAGITDPSQVPPGESTDFLAISTFTNRYEAVNEAIEANAAEGITNVLEGMEMAFTQLQEELNQGGAGGVCGKVTLKLDQEAVISRDAFSATLEVANESAFPLEDFTAEIAVMNAAGELVTDLFGIHPPTLSNLGAVDGSDDIVAGVTARVNWIMVPTVDAAPDAPVRFFVSGTMSYRQNGVAIAVPLASVPITVYPSPRLHVKYFHQRDVYADDPFTEPIEPSIPFSLAVMVENRGNGVARNVRIASAQPEIVENEKGLLVDFRILTTEVAGQNLRASLEVNLGTIGSHQIAIGRWLLSSSLQGLFTDYQASFEHIDGLGNPKLSLIEEVTIHEMIRLVQAGGAFEDGRPDFLVNEIPDPRDLPDTLFLSSGVTNPVAVIEESLLDQPPSPTGLVVQLTAPMPAGWAYLRVPEPSDGQYRLVRVQRSNGSDVPLGTNVWTTDRTFIGLGKRPVNENLLHLLDYDSAGAYTLSYELPPPPDTNAPISAVAALPASSPLLFRVQWEGEDLEGGGIALFDVYVSTNGSPFVPWLQRTTLTDSTYEGLFGVQYAFYSVATDPAGNRELPPETFDAVTTVSLTNHPPQFVAVNEQALDEGTTWQFVVAATDPDTNILVYSLSSGAPQGAVINPDTGRITWATGEGTGPSTNVFRVIARDNGLPPLSATTSVTLVVREVNRPPALAPLASHTVNEGSLLTFSCQAMDNDLPANLLRFSLRPDAPQGATVDEYAGVFAWEPAEFQGPSTNYIAVVVSDNGQPSLSATQVFAVIVRDYLSDFSMNLGWTNLLAGESNSVPVILNSGLELSQVSFVLTLPPGRLTNLTLHSASSEVLSSTLQPAGPGQYEFGFTLDPQQMPGGTRTLAQLGFVAVSNQSSVVIRLKPSQLTGLREGGLTVPRATIQGGHIIIVAEEPVLWFAHGSPPAVYLYGRPGRDYSVEYAEILVVNTIWIPLTNLQLNDRWTEVPVGPWPSPSVYYRVYETGSVMPLLTVKPAGNGNLSLGIQGAPGRQYLIQTTSTPTDPASWLPVSTVTLTNRSQSVEWLNTGEEGRFFRVLAQ